MNRALKHAALDPPDACQEPLPFFSEPGARPVVEEPAAQIQPAPHTRPASFYDEDGRFVPRCGCGAYGSFGLGLNLDTYGGSFTAGELIFLAF